MGLKVNTLQETNEVFKNLFIGAIIIAIAFGLVFAGLLQLLIIFLIWLIKLIIKHWVKVLIGVFAILMLRKLLRRKKG